MMAAWKVVFLYLILLTGNTESFLLEDCYVIKELQEICKQRGLSLVHQNIRGLQANFENLCAVIDNHNIDILTLSETHLYNDEPQDLVSISGYELITRNRTSGKGGGVCIYIKEGIIWERREDLESKNIENIWVEIFFKNSHSFLICCIYRPPDTSKYLPKTFNNDFDVMLQSLTKEAIVMGDCNVNYAKSNDNREFKSILSLNGFKQLVNEPTRTTHLTSTIIDIIATNKENIKETKVIPSSFLRKLNHRKFAPKTIRCRDYSKYNPEIMKQHLHDADWSSVYETTNVNDSIKAFNEILETNFNEQAPIIEKKVKGRPCPWLTEPLKRAMNERDKMLRKAKKSNKEIDRSTYKKLRNRCNNQLRQSKSKYHQNQLNENELSPKRFWDTLKKIFPTKQSTSVPKTNNRKQLTETFSNWFASVVKKLKEKAMPLRDFVWGYSKSFQLRTTKSFRFEYVSVVHVRKHLKKLKRTKATGLDNLPPAILKDTADIICKPLCHIINSSLRNGSFPEVWKKARVVPVFKSGKTSLPENYRPISIVPVLSKILEKAVHHQLSLYLEDNKLLSDRQFGFRHKRSTEMASTLLCDSIRQRVGEGKLVGAVFLDLSRAFDTINHANLLNHLKSYGVSGSELEWFRDYLFGRTQVVDVDSVYSSIQPLYTGVPQGTILGPLLFNIFFNTFEECLKNSNTLQYADDTVIYIGHKDIKQLSKLLNEDLSAISNFFYENELLANLKKGKTESMLFGTNQRLSKINHGLELFYREQIIKNTDSYKYLGNIVDPSLTLNTDFDAKYKKASNRLKLLARVRPFLTKSAALKIYNMLIIPILTYCSQLHSSKTKTQSSKLQSIYNRAYTIIGQLNARLQNPEHSMSLNNCLFVRKCMDRRLCANFHDYFTLLQHTKNTRGNNSLLKLPRVKLEFERKGFYFFGAKVYNELPNEIRQLSEFESFKKSLKDQFF